MSDFDAQIKAVLEPRAFSDRFEKALAFLEQLYLEGLRPRS